MRVIVNGAYGRMGRIIRRVIEEGYGGAVVAAAVDSAIPGNMGGGYCNNIYDVVCESDVVIDFSSPDATEDVVEYALRKSIPLVIGTTGIKDKSPIYRAAEKIPVFFSGNMSKGIFALIKASEEIERIIPESDSEIIEIHHKNKKDSPGGTALMMNNVLGLDCDIKSLRIGDVTGVHTVYFGKSGELITLTHMVTDRRVFAEGAIDAARFLMCKDKGLYSLNDLYQTN